MKKNDIIRLKIESITNLGFGVGRKDGLVIFVGGLVSGDEADVRIIKLTPSYAVGKTETLIKKSEHRCEGRCHIDKCSSCAYKNINYTHELNIKKDDVRQAFIKAGLSGAEVDEIIPSPSEYGYRNKAQYPITKDKSGEYIVGFYAPKSHRVTEARECPLLPSVFGDIVNELTEFFKRHSLSVYDEESGKGLLRHIYLRRGEVSGEILLTLVINGSSVPNSDELVSALTERFPSIVGILLNVNKDKTNVILGEKFITLYGRDYIYDTLSGVELKIGAPSFYQVNHGAAELLYAKAKELAKPTKDDLLLDLFCGAGSIGLSMADFGCEIIGIEIVEDAVLCARENAARAGIKNAKFYTGDATGTEALLRNAERELGRKIKPTIVVLDPPRAGCDEKLIRYISSLSPKRVVYVSCNPTTLARDVAVFRSLGYEYGKITAVDLFPLTGHVETIVCLRKQ